MSALTHSYLIMSISGTCVWVFSLQGVVWLACHVPAQYADITSQNADR